MNAIALCILLCTTVVESMPFFSAKTSHIAVDDFRSTDEVASTFIAVDENGDGVLDTAEAAAFVFELMHRSVQLTEFAKTSTEQAGSMIQDLTTSLSMRCPLTLADVKAALHTSADSAAASAAASAEALPQFVNDDWTLQGSSKDVTTWTKEAAVKHQVTVAGYTTESALAFLSEYHRAGCSGIDETIQTQTITDGGTAHIIYKPMAFLKQRDIVVKFAPVSFPLANHRQGSGWSLTSVPSADARFVHVDIVAAAIVVSNGTTSTTADLLQGTSAPPAASSSPAPPRPRVDIVFASAVDPKLNWFTRYLASAFGLTGSKFMQRAADAMKRAISNPASKGPCHFDSEMLPLK